MDLTPAALTTGPPALQAQQQQPQAAAQDALWLEAPGTVAAGEEFTVRLELSGSGTLAGVSAQLEWNAAVAMPVTVSAGNVVNTVP